MILPLCINGRNSILPMPFNVYTLMKRYTSVRLFTDPPAWLTDVDYVTTGLPKDFIETADKELKLNGELISYVKARGGVLPGEKIPRMGDSESQAFFSHLNPPSKKKK